MIQSPGVCAFYEWQKLRTASLDLVSNQFALDRLSLQWESLPEACHDYRQFLKKSRDETLLCTASSNFHKDIVTEVWNIEERVMIERLQSPGTQTSCMDWLSDNSFVTGGHDNSMTLWRDGQRAGVYESYRLLGHYDWVRSVGVNLTDSIVASGDADSVIGIWDLPRLQKTSLTVLPRCEEVQLNAVMDLCFSPASPFLFYVLQRSGHLSMWDVRVARPKQWHARAHSGHTSSIKASQNSTRLLTSSRGSEVKMWDTRRMFSSSDLVPHLQIFNEHPSEKLALGCDFLFFEQFVISGSDDESVYIYETATGRLAKKVKLAPGQVVTATGVEYGSMSFFAVYMNGRYFGLVDTEGDSEIVHGYTSSEQIKARYSKEAWDAAFSRNTDRVLVTARLVQDSVAINYEQMMAAIRDSELPACKQLMHDLTAEYEANVKASTPRLVRDLQHFFSQSHRSAAKPTPPPSHYPQEPSDPTFIRKEQSTLATKMRLFQPLSVSYW